MPTFTAIAFDRLIEPGASDSMVPPMERRHSGREMGSKLERGVSVPHIPQRKNKEHHWTQISPALYATPVSTPLPDSPSSFPPSPYIINHKRRGPRLMKSFSEYDVAAWKRDEIKVVDENENGIVAKDDTCVSIKVPDLNGDANILPWNNGVLKSLGFNSQQDGEVDDSMGVKSESEDYDAGAETPSINLMTPFAEFYDAWEELSSENGTEIQLPDIESELREIRLGLLMEIEKRKHAEEALCHMRNQWQIIREKLCLVGLTLPVVPTNLPVGEQQRPDDLVCQQVHLARFVSNSIGRGIAKAEVEMEMEAQIKLKNAEIARLWDRLHYYEAVNQEMSQRNQQVVEMTRRLRQRRKRRQKWIWGSIASAITIGSAALAYSYFHTSSQSPSVDRDTN